MGNEFLEQFRVLNNLIYKSNNLDISHFRDISNQINNIGLSINKVNHDFINYQSNFTNQPWFSFVVGSAVTVLAALLLNFLSNKKQRKDNLYYLERILVDQINLIIDIKRTINSFLPKIDGLINNINNTPETAYSADMIFFPLFSSRSLPDEINRISSGSSYIDNKINRDYHMSKDLPHMIDDLRGQLDKTIQKNENIVFAALNPHKVQKDQFRRNITEYKMLVKRDVLDRNIPLYIHKLSETIIAVRELRKIGIIRWKLKFQPKYKFYLNKKLYESANKSLHGDMDTMFKENLDIFLKGIENEYNK